MEPAASIRKLGFRKWYERQLIYSHLSLTACLVCGITIAALVEEVNFLEFGRKALSLLGLLAAVILLAFHTWRRYITVLGRAERYGQRSTCPQCEAYGRFEVLASGGEADPVPAAAADAPPLPAAWLHVQCRKCGTTWSIP